MISFFMKCLSDGNPLISTTENTQGTWGVFVNLHLPFNDTVKANQQFLLLCKPTFSLQNSMRVWEKNVQTENITQKSDVLQWSDQKKSILSNYLFFCAKDNLLTSL